MTEMLRTPLLNPQLGYCSIEELLQSNGFKFDSFLDNSDFPDKIKIYGYRMRTGEIKDFRIVPSYIARDGESIPGREDWHSIYIKE